MGSMPLASLPLLQVLHTLFCLDYDCLSYLNLLGLVRPESILIDERDGNLIN